MTERPILFDGESVRAILAGHKWQTRRVVKPQPQYVWGFGVALNSNEFTAHVRYPGGHQPDPWVRCPYGAPPHRGQPGDRLWVREGWAVDGDDLGAVRATYESVAGGMYAGPYYRADQANDNAGLTWRSPLFMPRWASRLLLTVMAVRVERLHEITPDDIRAEGLQPDSEASLLWRENLRDKWSARWDAINGKKHPWASDPWVWVVSFEVCDVS